MFLSLQQWQNVLEVVLCWHHIVTWIFTDCVVDFDSSRSRLWPMNCWQLPTAKPLLTTLPQLGSSCRNRNMKRQKRVWMQLCRWNTRLVTSVKTEMGLDQAQDISPPSMFLLVFSEGGGEGEGRGGRRIVFGGLNTETESLKRIMWVQTSFWPWSQMLAHVMMILDNYVSVSVVTRSCRQ